MRNRVIHRNSRAGDSPFRLLAAALAVLTLTLLAVMVPCEEKRTQPRPSRSHAWATALRTAPNPVAARKATPHIRRGSAASSAVAMTCAISAPLVTRCCGARAGHIGIRPNSGRARSSPRYRHHHARHQRFQGRLLERDTVQDRGEGAGEVYRDLASRPVVYFASSPHSYRIAPVPNMSPSTP